MLGMLERIAQKVEAETDHDPSLQVLDQATSPEKLAEQMEQASGAPEDSTNPLSGSFQPRSNALPVRVASQLFRMIARFRSSKSTVLSLLKVTGTEISFGTTSSPGSHNTPTRIGV
jgi:hypothetical protein